MVQQIEWTKRALADLYGIYEFIAKDSKRYAQNREILVGNYRVLYRFEKEKGQVLVISIAHGRRLLKGPLQ